MPEPLEHVETTDAPARVVVADEVLLASVDLARRALLDVTPAQTVGSVAGHLVEDEHVLTLLFASDLSGYPGWHWSVTIARVDDAEPTVVETELMPGATALLAPEWVPWSERLADYRAAQEALAAAAPEAAEDEAGDDEGLDDELDEDELDEEHADDGLGDDGDDDDDDDDDDLDDEAELDGAFGRDAGDDEFDGIDIDALDDSGDDDADDDGPDDDSDDDGRGAQSPERAS